MNLRKTLCLIGIPLTAIPLLVIAAVMHQQNRNIVQLSIQDEQKKGIASLDALLHSVNRMCQLEYLHTGNGNPAALKKEIGKIRVGKTGYVFIVQGTGEQQGRYIVSKDHTRDGENIWNSQDQEGHYFIRDICRKALQLTGQEIAEQRYPWINPGEIKPRMKITRVAYFKPWDWVIGVGAYEDEFMEQSNRILAIGRQATLSLTLVTVLALAAAVVIWLYVAGTLARPLTEMVGVLKKVAEGDFTQHVAVTSKNEIGQIALALNQMSRMLSEIVGRVHAVSRQVASGSSEISDASQSLAQGATEQASSLEEITSAATEIGSQVRTNAENAAQASQLAVAARGIAEKGTSYMEETASAMEQIQSASREISKIIKVIDDIAFQTNLLALNAAVEAARAGRQGRGFAVVAEEVRHLAARSAKAAESTAEMIENSVEKIKEGNSAADQTSRVFKEIVGSVSKVAELMSEIASASNEQAKGITQISQGLGQIEQVTEKNTSSAQQTAAAAEEFSAQAVELQNLLSRFKLNQAAPGVPAENRSIEKAPDPMLLPASKHAHHFDDVEFGKY